MKKSPVVPIIASMLLAAAAAAPAAGPETSAAEIIAKCAKAMGGEAAVKAVRALRLEVVYPDHDAAPVFHEIRLPNRLRTERPGSYIAVFDGQRGAMFTFDPAKPGQPLVRQELPEGAERGFETDLVWFYPLFFEYPAAYAGVADIKGTKCHKLVVALPLGSRAEYLIDADTFLVRAAVVEETYQGQTYRLEREWLDLRPVRGVPYPSRMSYQGRDGKTAIAELVKIEINPVLAADRFEVPPRKAGR